MARVKKTSPKPSFFTRSFTLSDDIEKTLHGLSQDAKDFLGRAVGGAAILRALVRYADRQGEIWAREHLFPLIEEELSAGVVWGKKK